MSGKSPRQSPVHAQHSSKLPKFLQKSSTRDRSKSITEPSGSASVSSLASGSGSSSSEVPPSKPRKSKFLIRDRDDKNRRSTDGVSSPPHSPLPPPPPSEPDRTSVDEPPVIIEPVAIPRPRLRSERSLSHGSDVSPGAHLSLYASTSATSRIGDLPTRLSGWFSHTFSTSSTDLSLPSLLASPSPSKTKSASAALLTAAKHGKGHLDKAVRYILDSDSTPDKCTEPIWILGVQHPGYEPPPPATSLSASTSSSRAPSLRASTSSTASHASNASTLDANTPSKNAQNPAANWPPVFYADFTSRVWLTYRSQFAPIRDVRLADLSGSEDGAATSSSPTPVRSRPWGWIGGGEKGWTSDSGWGCMLRTGQSLLANALIHLHLGRDWRRPPHAVHTADYATYVQIVTWFFDTPTPEAPFSVHRMALAGKELGTDVGQWFGPSTAAGAIKTLVNAFPEAGLGVSVATDGTLFETDVFAASHTGASSIRSPRRHVKALSSSWGDRPVLVLIGVRLGIGGVNPIYYDTIKSVGIAGGRPSSSYYFVGSQADNLFYLDPHHARPAIPLRPPPPNPKFIRDTTPESDFREFSLQGGSSAGHRDRERAQRRSGPTSPSSIRTGGGGSSTFSYHAPLSPSPLQQEFSTSSETDSNRSNSQAHTSPNLNPRSSRSPPPSVRHHHQSRFRSASHSHSPSPSEPMDVRELSMSASSSISVGPGALDPVQEHYVTAYHGAELKTFHCERVRKMPLSGLDPSMLIGFLCKNKADWYDFRKRVEKLPRTVFSVQDEPPSWPSDSDDNLGLESISEPDDLDMDLGSGDEDGAVEEDEEESEQFFDTRSASASMSSASASGSGSPSGRGKGKRAKSEEVDTEEDPVDPITPLPNARFAMGSDPQDQGADEDQDEDEVHRFEEGDIEDDWIDPSIPSTPAGPPQFSQKITTVAASAVESNVKREKKSRKGKKGEVPVPVPLVKIPLPSSNRPPQEHFPFPVSQRADETSAAHAEQRSRTSSTKATGKRMHTARARDGGRTQSGGVKGILTED
ncbi:hypothetical protein H0H81_010067 [Sphagnurus paluster]|uniref:Autophagy-related protein 4 n=1 Tax=Sphagnurus paluster TaxID=117069 RepID=A0A9P7GQ26_9AGAR|nr:hypothetical protein H0H81_010067 [Sphagnurus paluster]